MAVIGGGILLAAYTGQGPDGRVALLIGGVCLLGGLYGVVAPERSLPKKTGGGGVAGVPEPSLATGAGRRRWSR